ncbi:unnamed protein product, partial [Dibothriocephalus latus]
MARRIPLHSLLKDPADLITSVFSAFISAGVSGAEVFLRDQRLPKRLFYSDVTMGARRKEGQNRCYKDTLKNFLKRLQINMATCEELAQDRSACRRTVNTDAAICGASRITVDFNVRLESLEEADSVPAGQLCSTTNSNVSRIIASSFGGMIASLAVTPLDVVKIRMQAASRISSCEKCFLYCNGLMDHLCASLNSAFHTHGPWYNHTTASRTAWEALSKIVKSEGILSLWSGLSPTSAMALPQTVNLHYGCFSSNDFVPAVVGALSRTVVVFAISPLELLRTKLQSQKMSFTNICDVLQSTINSSSFRSLWIGMGPTFFRDVPYSAIFWLVDDYNKYRYLPKVIEITPLFEPITRPIPSFSSAFFFGACAGFTAGVITHPFGVVKTH